MDDDSQVREAISRIFQDQKRTVEAFATAEAFLAAFQHDADACVLIDNHLPGMSGLELLQKLREGHHHLPAIMITGDSDVQIVVQAMKAGAADFIEKPISRSALLQCVDRAFEQSRDSSALSAWQQTAAAHIAGLTPRQRQIMGLVLAGHTSKNIAVDLGIIQRTVENHRALIMEKTKTKSLPALARLALAAARKEPTE